MSTKNKKMEDYLENRINQGTVILCFKILLEEVVKNGTKATMVKSEINREFDKQHENFGVGTFRSDYMLRQSSEGELNAVGVKADNKTYYIRADFLDGLSTDDLKSILENIDKFYTGKTLENRRFLNRLKKSLELDVPERKSFILEMLRSIETDKKGQAFEVTAFSILKTFYHIRGFELNRFSTIYSNDGGIDYTSQAAVYQVTTHLDRAKFKDDLRKAPLKNRVFVFKKMTGTFDTSLLDNDLILDHITLDDLINHLDYLIEKRPEKNSRLILDTISKEYEREYYFKPSSK